MRPPRIDQLWQVTRLVALCLLAYLVAPSPALAEGPPASEQRLFAFAGLASKVQPQKAILPGESQRIVEWFARHGFNIVHGKAERDVLEMPALVLSGALVEVGCQAVDGSRACRLGIVWELVDRLRHDVTYTVTTRAVVRGTAATAGNDRVGSELLSLALSSLAGRGRFRAALARVKAAESPLEPATFLPCSAAAMPMPGAAQEAMGASVLLETDRGMGSGFFLNQDGLILTAAHVIVGAERISVRTLGGAAQPARLVRFSEDADVALLSVEGREHPCLPYRGDLPSLGEEVYALGAPIGIEFTLSRGIVSGLRKHWTGAGLVQTDTPVSPGNSGGPLVDANGQVVAVIDSKMVGEGIENIAFGVGMASTLEALGLEPGATTGTALYEAAKVVRTSGPVVDVADPLPPWILPTTVSSSAEPEGERPPPEPPGRGVLRWTGVGVTAAGLLTTLISYAAYHPETSTRQEHDQLVVANDVGWILAGAGLGMIGVAFFWPARPSSEKKQVSLATRGAGLSLEVVY